MIQFRNADCLTEFFAILEPPNPAMDGRTLCISEIQKTDIEAPIAPSGGASMPLKVWNDRSGINVSNDFVFLDVTRPVLSQF